MGHTFRRAPASVFLTAAFSLNVFCSGLLLINPLCDLIYRLNTLRISVLFRCVPHKKYDESGILHGFST